MEELQKTQIEKKFYDWIKLMRPEKMKFNPTFIEIKNGNVIFGMMKYMGRLVVSIETINSELENNQKEENI